jgi:hypothetical protein
MDTPPPAGPESARPLVGIVGPCSAGKSTLARGLAELGVPARAIGQEHSYVPHMWQTLTRPDVLVFLDVSFDQAQARRWLSWQPKDLDEQHRRLAHARQHCHLYLHTDGLSIDEVRQRVVSFLRRPTPEE